MNRNQRENEKISRAGVVVLSAKTVEHYEWEAGQGSLRSIPGQAAVASSDRLQHLDSDELSQPQRRTGPNARNKFSRQQRHHMQKQLELLVDDVAKRAADRDWKHVLVLGEGELVQMLAPSLSKQDDFEVREGGSPSTRRNGMPDPIKLRDQASEEFSN